MLRGLLIFLAGAIVCGGACANRLPPVSKLVNNRRIVTRSVNPSAYEHASRAFLYEQEGRLQDAAAELQRALVFDDESPELQARLAEVFIRLGRMEDAAAAIAASPLPGNRKSLLESGLATSQPTKAR